MKSDNIMRILVVEDDLDDFILFRKTLSQVAGVAFDVIRAPTYESGLEALSNETFDICFVDFRLGARNGIELLNEAKRRGVTRPFIILTGVSDRRTDLAAMEAGAADFLVKDFSKPELFERVIRYSLERERTASELRRARDELEQRVSERTEELHHKVDELRASEARERQARGEAEQTSRMKDEFLANLSHELRTPMNSILGYSNLIQEKTHESDEELFAWLSIIQRNAQAQMALIEELLDTSRIVTGKLTINFADVDMVNIVKNVVDSFDPQVKQHRLQISFDNNLVTSMVRGDAARLEQIVRNILSNAIKFTPDGRRIEITLDDDDRGKLRFRVRDEGNGITPCFLPHIFDRFLQEDGRLTRKRGGLGLGLSLVKHLVEAHEGSITAESEGQRMGAMFTVTLPHLR